MLSKEEIESMKIGLWKMRAYSNKKEKQHVWSLADN